MKQFERLLVDTFYVLAGFSRIAIDKVFDQQRDVRSSLSKRRHLDREDVQPIKQITAERASADGGLQVTIGGCNHPNVCTDSTGAADTLKLMLLQNTQECDLSLSWKFAHFVKEDGSPACEFKSAQALLSCACEGTLFVAEQLRGDQVTRDGGTVYANEGTRGAI